jgi:hypothetical protein
MMSACARSLLLLLLLAVALSPLSCKKRPKHKPLAADAGLNGGNLLFEEDFADTLANWTTTSANWKIVDGRLYTGDRPEENKGLWLGNAVSLPENVRIEFDATSVKGNKPEFEGDLKCEFGGDRKEHAAGYIIIFGGWKNTVNTIARHDEHGEGRLVVDSSMKVKEGETYRLQIVRLGSEIKWFVNSKLLLRVNDKEPALGGAFGFNNWNSRVYFDNVRIYAL